MTKLTARKNAVRRKPPEEARTNVIASYVTDDEQARVASAAALTGTSCSTLFRDAIPYIERRAKQAARKATEQQS